MASQGGALSARLRAMRSLPLLVVLAGCTALPPNSDDAGSDLAAATAGDASGSSLPDLSVPTDLVTPADAASPDLTEPADLATTPSDLVTLPDLLCSARNRGCNLPNHPAVCCDPFFVCGSNPKPQDHECCQSEFRPCRAADDCCDHNPPNYPRLCIIVIGHGDKPVCYKPR